MPVANNKARFLVWEPAKFSQLGCFQVVSLVCQLCQLWVLLRCDSSVAHTRWARLPMEDQLTVSDGEMRQLSAALCTPCHLATC